MTRGERLAAERAWDWHASERNREARRDERRAVAAKVEARAAAEADEQASVGRLVGAIRATQASLAADADAAQRRAQGAGVTAADGVAAARARVARRRGAR